MDSTQLTPSRFNLYTEVQKREVVFNLSSGACIEAPKDSFLRMGAQADAAEVLHLTENGFLVHSGVDETQVIKSFWERARHDSSTSFMTIVPTLECNFGCDYCYAPRGSGVMSADTARRVVAFMERLRRAVRELCITWLGGEPLLALDAIVRVEDGIRERTGTVISQVVTNGSLLNRKTARRLASMGIGSAVVSVDGPREMQRVRRRWKRGDSYEKVLANIAAACDELRITLRVNVDRHNLELVPTLMEDLDCRGLLANIEVSIVPTQPFNKKCDHIADRCLSSPDDLLALLDLCKKNPALSWGGPPPYLGVCNAVRVQDFGISPDGQLYKCPIEIGEPQGRVGALAGGPIEPAMLRWLGYRPRLKKECNNCICLPLCIGFCPRLLGFRNSTALLKCEPTKSFHEALVKHYLGRALLENSAS